MFGKEASTATEWSTSDDHGHPSRRVAPPSTVFRITMVLLIHPPISKRIFQFKWLGFWSSRVYMTGFFQAKLALPRCLPRVPRARRRCSVPAGPSLPVRGGSLVLRRKRIPRGARRRSIGGVSGRWTTCGFFPSVGTR